jgi:hypothetical protein
MTHRLVWVTADVVSDKVPYDYYLDIAALSALRTPYVGDNSAVGKIIDALPPLTAELKHRFFSIGDDYGTGAAPYTLNLYYEQDGGGIERDIAITPKNATLLFTLINNLEEVSFAFRETLSDGDLDKTAYTSRIAYSKENIDEYIGSLGLIWGDFENEWNASVEKLFAPVGSGKSSPQTMFEIDADNGNKITLYSDIIDQMQMIHILSGQPTGYGIADKRSIELLNAWVGGLSISKKQFTTGGTPGDSDGGEVYDFSADDGTGLANLFSYVKNGPGESYIIHNGEWYGVRNPSDPPMPSAPVSSSDPSFEWSQLPDPAVTSSESFEWSQIPDPVVEHSFDSTWAPIEQLPPDYGKDAAIEDGVYVNIHGSEIYNQKLVDVFYENALTGRTAYMRTMEFTVEGDPIITDYQYDGEIFTVITDTGRNKFGAQEISTAIYRYLVPHDRSRPAGTPQVYFLSNEQNIYTETAEGETTFKDGLCRISSPSDNANLP